MDDIELELDLQNLRTVVNFKPPTYLVVSYISNLSDKCPYSFGWLLYTELQ